jgi:meiotic recombination protein SPO11
LRNFLRDNATEKYFTQAVFSTLATSTLLDDGDLGNGIILTGKGYPDIATRDLLKLLADSYPA